MKSAVERAYDAIVVRGEEMTSAQIASRFGVTNPRDLIYRLRGLGYKIGLRPVTKNGRTVNKYAKMKKAAR